MKTDCFAYFESAENEPQPACAALSQMLCMHTENCPFYKSKVEQNKQLDEIHGTHDLKEILQNYAALS